jgi:hypothetical protein
VKTYDAEAATDLLEARKRWEHSRGLPWHPEPGFFPAYRSEGTEPEATSF